VPEQQTLTKSRVWRVSPPQFERAAQSIAATSSYTGKTNPFSGSVSGQRFNNYANAFSLEEAEVDALFRAADAATISGLGDNKMPGCIRNAYRDNVAPTQECRESIVSYVGLRLFRRQLTPEEVERYQVRMGALVDATDPQRGIRAGIKVIFAAPEALFRFEIGGEADANGEARLTDNEIANALSFTLLDATPSTGLLGEARMGSFSDLMAIIATATDMMSTTKAWQFPAVMRRFAEQYFHYDIGFQVFKDASFSAYNFGRHHGAMERFIDEMVARDTDFVFNLLTSTAVWDEDGNITDDPQRAGVLHREAWLISYSNNIENQPIQRGHFIRESLLCGEIPEIPIDVVAQLPEGNTMRERLSIHSSEPRCAGCHSLMDGLGLPFQQFDHFGQWRDTEGGLPVDTSGNVIGVASDFDGPVTDSYELVDRLARSYHVERCFIRHLFRFTMGRNETYGDACTLAAAHQAYRDSGGSIRATPDRLVTSDPFLQPDPTPQMLS